jgi:hypothetical protein
MKPFADNEASLTIGGLTVENGVDKVSLYGSLDLPRDRSGLEQARALKRLVDACVAALKADPALPDRQPPPVGPSRVRNPFE